MMVHFSMKPCLGLSKKDKATGYLLGTGEMPHSSMLIHTDKVKGIEYSNNCYMNQGMSVGHAVTKVREILCAVYRPGLSGGIS